MHTCLCINFNLWGFPLLLVPPLFVSRFSQKSFRGNLHDVTSLSNPVMPKHEQLMPNTLMGNTNIANSIYEGLVLSVIWVPLGL